MPVVDVRVRYDVHQLSGLQARHLRQHHQQHGILHHVPVVGRKDVLRPLVEYAVQSIALDIEGHRVRARLKSHLREILEVVEVGHDAAAVLVILETPQHVVHLVHLALLELVLLGHLVAVCFSYGTLFICPLVPDMALQICQPVGLFLPDPEHLVGRQLDRCRPQRERRKLLRKVIAVDHSEVLYRMRRRAVLPVRADRHPLGAETVVEDVPAHIHEKLICLAH